MQQKQSRISLRHRALLQVWIGCALWTVFAGSATVAEARQVWIVQFRMPEWRTVHFPNAEQAARLLATVKQLGCEAEQHDHQGHIDVRYRCLKWKQMKLATDEEAHRWVHWLQKIGFQTAHEH